MKKVLLYSSGMDSWLIDKLWKPDVKLFIRLHTPSNEVEYERIKNDKSVTIKEFDLSEFEDRETFFLPLRNLHLVTLASHYGDMICLGSVAYSIHKDNNETFKFLSESVINYLLLESNRRISIVMPYWNKSKTELLSDYLKQGGDIEKAYKETFSCYKPEGEKECMNCLSCISKFVAFYNNGYKFSESEVNKFINFCDNYEDELPADVNELYEKLKK